MKKTTLILVALALALGAFVYFGDVKGKLIHNTPESTSQPAFASVKGEEVSALTLERAGQKIQFEKNHGAWVITEPVQTRADQSALNRLVNDLAAAQITRTLKGGSGGLAKYGLDAPAVRVRFNLKSGKEHKLELGAKDFSGNSVYAQVDGGAQVVLVPESVLASADKSLQDLRDRSVLGVSNWDINRFDLKNASGEIVAGKEGSDWKLEKPRLAAADSSAVDSLLNAVSSGKMTAIVSETPEKLASYGLTRPAITLRVRDLQGTERTLLIGRKTGGEYYARDSARPLVFRVSSDLHDKLAEKFFALRDKKLVHFERDTLKQVTIRNRNQTVVCEQDSGGKWAVEQPADHKGKEAKSWKFLDPLETASATAIYDSPPAAIAARLAKPAIEVTLTGKSGKSTTIRISAPAGDWVYARSSAGPAIFKLKKESLDDLNFKLADLVF